MSTADVGNIQTLCNLVRHGDSYKSATSWRQKAAVVIAAVVGYMDHVTTFGGREHTLSDWKEALSTAYPFGPKSHTPYKIWQEESGKVLAARFAEVRAAKDLRMARAQERERLKHGRSPLPDLIQARLFGGAVII